MSDVSTIICPWPADKGKEIITKVKNTYLAKMQQQIDKFKGDNKLQLRKEKILH